MKFRTEKSGVLTAEKSTQNRIEMKLPLNPPSVEIKLSTDIWRLANIFVPNTDDIQEVKLSPTTKKLLVRVKDHLGRGFIENLASPDLEKGNFCMIFVSNFFYL